MFEGILSVLEASRDFLPSLLPIFFTISFLLMITTFVLSFRDIRKQFRIKRFTLMILILIFLLGISLRILTPIYMTTYTDEFAHIETGKNIVTYGRADMCMGYADLESRNCGLFNEPAGFPYFVGLFLLLLGVSETSAYAVNLIMGSLLSVIIFFFCLFLSKNEKVSLYSAFVVSILPLNILFSRNIEPDTVSAFFILLTFLGFLLFFKIRDLKTGVFAVSILAFSISIKQENILLIPLVFLLSVIFLDLKSLKHSIKNYKSWFLFALLIVLITPHIFHLSWELYPSLFFGEQTATAVGGKLINIENISTSFSRSLVRAFDGTFYPILINLFILIGAVYAFKIYRKIALFLIIFFFLFIFVYLAYSGLMLERYLVNVITPLIFFAGLGMYSVEKFLISKSRGIVKDKMINFAIPLLIVLILFLLFIPYFYEIGEGLKPLSVTQGYPRNTIQYEEKRVINLIGGELDSCYVVAEWPSLLSATDLKIITTESVLSDTRMVRDVIENGDCIFYFEDLYCTDFYTFGNRCGIENETFESCEEVRQNIVSKCRKMHEVYNLSQYLKYESGEFTFTVYNISLNLS